MEQADQHVLNIILPSGDRVTFETVLTFHGRYMEAFGAGGEYQWQVIAQDNDGQEICVSDIVTYNKPPDENPHIDPIDGENNGISGVETCWDGSAPG